MHKVRFTEKKLKNRGMVIKTKEQIMFPSMGARLLSLFKNFEGQDKVKLKTVEFKRERLEFIWPCCNTLTKVLRDTLGNDHAEIER